MFEQKTHNAFSLCSFALFVLVMSAIGLTVLIDNGVKRGELEQNVSEQRQKIMNLEQVVSSLEAKQASADYLAQIEEDKLSVMKTQEQVLLANLKNLRSAERVAAAELESVEKEFDTYKGKTRKLIWSKYVGYRFGTLTIEYDRTYKGVRISEISEHGVKIDHDNGTSFIRSNSMPVFLQKKFQLVLGSGYEGTAAP